ncbi:hypothetical protein Salat_1696000 [Sesamum alatum]|uniref:Uncharacterized protein n=1 Tax=Sesamum alatum TaxID=300844 RepID=A0AAE1Y7X6_9LAMI|nr:hypothetical protein Salat_1696000 [Sesamum alatum]
MVQFTYERLPNFCYIYGKLGISFDLRLTFQEGFEDLGKVMPYWAWIRENAVIRSPLVSTGLSPGASINSIFIPYSLVHSCGKRPSYWRKRVFGDFRQPFGVE